MFFDSSKNNLFVVCINMQIMTQNDNHIDNYKIAPETNNQKSAIQCWGKELSANYKSYPCERLLCD
jgi:hypothetical protein